MGLLDGQRALITGGASGIGRATARMMAAEGARVAVADINGEGAKEVAGEIDGLAFELDVTDLDAFQAAVQEAASSFGGLTIAFNNAGAGLLSNVHEYTGEQWDQVVRLNLGGVFNGMKAEVPVILESGGGSIVNTASISGVRPSAGEAPYAAAKAGVVALTQSG
ncbi:MAG TPA: SDR family NAD(P)-dependent oxidoreductase, partial [Actinomycetota bacterium]|nr:SDR family NAD(P)-dependent oxidoreductase [Actinomycetota bacterium]